MAGGGDVKILTLDIGGTAIKYGISDVPGELRFVRECPTNAVAGAQQVIQEVLEIVGLFPDADGIAIATAGTVDPLDGSIRYATDNLPGYTGTPLGRLVAQNSGKPVVVENDVYAAALGELYFGHGRHMRDFLFLTYGTGIGGAVIRQGTLFRGAHGTAGYFGHIRTHAGGRNCTCGQRGCYEAYASSRALFRDIERETGERLDGRRLFSQPVTEPKILGCMDTWIDEVCLGLVTLCNAFDPEGIVLGGGVMVQLSLIGEIRQRLPGCLPPTGRNVVILGSELGNTAGMLGVAQIMRMGWK